MLGQARQVRAQCARGDHDADRLGSQPAGGKGDDLRGGAVEPLGVIHQADEWPLGRHLGEETEEREANQEPVRHRAGADAEGDLKCLTLWCRQSLQVVEHRRAQLVERREREFHLGLDPGDRHDPAVGGPIGEVVQEGALAHARVPMDHESAALPTAQRVEEAVERAFFLLTAEEPLGAVMGFGRPHAHHGPTLGRTTPQKTREAAVGLRPAVALIGHLEPSRQPRTGELVLAPGGCDGFAGGGPSQAWRHWSSNSPRPARC